MGFKTEGAIKVSHCRNLRSHILCCQISVNARYAAFGCADGEIKIYLLAEGLFLFSLASPKETSNAVTDLRYHRLDPLHCYQLTATYTSGYIRVWDQVIQDLVHEQQIRSSHDVSSDTSHDPICDVLCCDVVVGKAAVGCSDGTVRVFTSALQPIITHPAGRKREVLEGHVGRVLVVRYHPSEDHILVSSGWDDVIYIWDDRYPHAVRHISSVHICGDAIRFNLVRNNYLLTGSWRSTNQLQVWDFNTGTLIGWLPQKGRVSCHVYCAQWSRKCNVVFGGSDSNTVVITDLINNFSIGSLLDLENGVCCLDTQDKPKISYIVCGAGPKALFMSYN